MRAVVLTGKRLPCQAQLLAPRGTMLADHLAFNSKSLVRFSPRENIWAATIVHHCSDCNPSKIPENNAISTTGKIPQIE
jgi:hypothetical protein